MFSLIFFVYFNSVAADISRADIKIQNGCNLNDALPLEAYFCEYTDQGGEMDENDQLELSVQYGMHCVFHDKETVSFITKLCDVHGWHDTDTFNTVPMSKDVVMYSHGRRVKRFLVLGLLMLVGVAGFICLFACNRERRDKSDPTMLCDDPAPKLADPIQVNTMVSWVEPTAYDDEDGTIYPQRSGPGPGDQFSEGNTQVIYFARDRAGNSKSCYVDVVVKVRRCPRLSPISDGYYQCHPSSDMVQGTTCRFGCYRGHRLTTKYTTTMCIGSIDIEEGRWSSPQPKCEKLKCEKLPPVVKPLHVKCTNGVVYRSICSFTCDPGYDIEPGNTRVMLCTETGSWRGSVPRCRDSEPPSFTKCVRYQIGFVDRRSETGRIQMFQEPIVTDNVDRHIKPQLSSKINPRDPLKPGEYEIVYIASDSAGNKAIDCHIKLVMKMITCHKIYPTASTEVTCDLGSRYGSNCEFTCQNMAELNGTKSVVCERKDQDPYGYWTWNNRQPFCMEPKRCTKQLNTPKNGALACDFWYGGRFCQMFCKDGYDVPRGLTISGNDMFICGESGKWMPSASVPNCAKVISSNKVKYRFNIKYHFTGSCFDPDVVKQIQEKFINRWQNSPYKDGCLHEAEKCVPSNIQVRCGGEKGKRSTYLRIEFIIEMEYPSDVDSDVLANLTTIQISTMQNLKDSISNGSLDIELDNNTMLMATDLAYTWLELQCGEGTVATKNKNSCAKCFPGTFYDKQNKTCSQCPRATYQPLEGQLSCIQCPIGQTTQDEGSIESDECKEACKPGSWSLDGTPPCTFCPKGTYQEAYGGMDCNVCPHALTTELDGASNFSECQEFDIYIDSWNASIEKSFNITSQSVYIQMWISIDDSDPNTSVVDIRIDGIQPIYVFGTNTSLEIIQDGFVEVKIEQSNGNKWHFLSIKLSRSETVFTLDEETKQINLTNSIYPSKGKLKIGDGFSGRISQVHIFGVFLDEMIVQKCFNNITGDILNWKEFEKSLLSDVFVQIPSECDDTNECDSSPCVHGNCTDELGDFSCQCFYGFEGEQCEHNIDDCIDNACDNNGTCIDGAATYECDCQPNYTGDLCEIKIVDGEWGDWGNWTSCSMSCGNGTRSRARLCNSPTPDNGGKDCIGQATEYEDCVEVECPVCPVLVEPENAILDCENDTMSDTINCTLSCKAGYDFDHDPKDYYYCGPETLHQWDIQTDGNPLNRLPSCTELKNATKLHIGYSATYAFLICDKSSKASDVEQAIKSVVSSASKNTECVEKELCVVSSLEVVNCSKSTRKKRDSSFRQAGFKIEFECDPSKHGSEECRAVLLNAFESMVNQTGERLLDSTVDGTVYPVDLKSLRVDSKVSCEDGMTPVDYRCVPCSKGKFEINGYCEECDFGTYQDKLGSKFCQQCPIGKSTLGKGSVNITECTVEKTIAENDHTTTFIVVGIVTPLCIIFILIVGFLCKRKVDRSRYNFGNDMKVYEFETIPSCDAVELKKFKELHPLNE